MTGTADTAKLGDQDVATVILGQSPPSSAYNKIGEGLPFFQGMADFGLLHPVPRVWCDGGQKFATAGDTLMSVRAPVGDVNIAAGDCVIGRGIAAIRAGARTDPWFLHFALMHCKPSLESRATGSTFASINKATLADLDIPFPDRMEQTIIAFVLRQLLEKIEQEIAIVSATREIKRAAMQALFTRGLRGEAQKETEIGPMPESWTVGPLGDHFSLVSGGTPSRSNPAYWRGGGIPWVKTGEVDYCVIRETEEHITQAGLEVSAAKLLPAGTLLLAMYGQGVTRGKVAILGIGATCNQACAAMRPTTGIVGPQYLYHYLTYRYDDIRRLAHGGQQQNLNMDIVRDLPIAFPPGNSEQQEIAAILDAIDRKIDLHRRKRAVLDELFKALLHKLMTGEIRVTDLDLSALGEVAASEPR